VRSALRCELAKYPGGLAKLAQDSGVPLSTIYRITSVAMRRVPMATLHSLVDCLERGRTKTSRLRALAQMELLWLADRASP
jgi:hypothetical protein